LSLADDLNRGQSTIGLEVLHKILQALIRMNPKVTDEAIKRYVVQSLEVLQHNTTVTTGFGDVINSRNFDHQTVFGYSKKINARARAYPLVHTTVGGGFTFPLAGSKYACQILGDGATYIRIDNHTWLDVGSGALVLAGFIKFTGTAVKTLITKRDSTTGAGYQLDITNSGDSLTITITDGTNTTTLQSTALATLNDGNWHSFVVNIPAAGNLEIFIDKTSRGTQTRGAVASLNNTRNQYVFARDNAGVFDQIYGERAALFFAAKKTWTQAMIDEFHDQGIIDIKDSVATSNVELFFIPFDETTNSRSNAFVGMFRASV